MDYIIRIKAVSECIGIRRGYVVYLKNEAREYDLKKLPHPLKKFNSIKIDNDKIIVNGEEKSLSPGYETYFYLNKLVEGPTSTHTEKLVLGALLMPLTKEMLPDIQESIDDGKQFDQWRGEFEFIMGLINEYAIHDMDEARFFYDKASCKGFTFKVLE